MKTLLALLLLASTVQAENLKSDVSYGTEQRQVLDIYAPDGAKDLPVMFWIHGGGWQQGDKSQVQLKPKIFNERGFVFVSTNYRLWPNVDMQTLISDCAKSLSWVHKNIAQHGGDPNRIFVGGHSAGAQLAAKLCIDDRYLKAEGVPFSALKGCVPVDGDTYDIPAIIWVAEMRALAHQLPMPNQSGHRNKFGNDPQKHLDFSCVTHVKKDKGIPPFLILHVAGQPDVTAQAKRLGTVLQAAEIPTTVFGARESTHNKLNNDLGVPDDAATVELYKFVDGIVGKK